MSHFTVSLAQRGAVGSMIAAIPVLADAAGALVGLRVRMGVATGDLSNGLPICQSHVMARAKGKSKS